MSSIPKSKHALRKLCSIVFNKHIDETVLSDIDKLKEIFQGLLDAGYSPKQIKEKYNLQYSDFGMFLKKCLGLSIKSHKDAALNFRIKDGSRLTDDKKIYKNLCQFKFNVAEYNFIPGLSKLNDVGFYHPIKNPNGLCRDHMISIEYGWVNKIDPKIISHPANCQLITNSDNISKNSDSCITIEQLLERIDNSVIELVKTKIPVTKSDSHRLAISKSIKKINLERKEKGLPALGGRPKKLVPVVGLEPTSD